jgi:hypothetical protein
VGVAALVNMVTCSTQGSIAGGNFETFRHMIAVYAVKSPFCNV